MIESSVFFHPMDERQVFDTWFCIAASTFSNVFNRELFSYNMCEMLSAPVGCYL